VHNFSVTDLVRELNSVLKANANPGLAVGMEAYMKGKFPFLGIKKPERAALSKPFLSQLKGVSSDELKQVILLLMESEFREVHYVALDAAVASAKRWRREDLPFLELLICTHSWWDTVDLIATHCFGVYFTHYPNGKSEWAMERIASENMWLRRTAILFQLKYKDKTDVELLEILIASEANSKEFFIQKVIGWVLREYAKTNPQWVIDFVERQPLKPLSRREAMKHLNA
jgi:3-methyladenine DNA glycosylase AlkD